MRAARFEAAIHPSQDAAGDRQNRIWTGDGGHGLIPQRSRRALPVIGAQLKSGRGHGGSNLGAAGRTEDSIKSRAVAGTHGT